MKRFLSIAMTAALSILLVIGVSAAVGEETDDTDVHTQPTQEVTTEPEVTTDEVHTTTPSPTTEAVTPTTGTQEEEVTETTTTATTGIDTGPINTPPGPSGNPPTFPTYTAPPYITDPFPYGTEAPPTTDIYGNLPQEDEGGGFPIALAIIGGIILVGAATATPFILRELKLRKIYTY
ncbi:MAG: hypothetical protein FWG45_05350 [Oscillospiraceae bacterium]|nr:hypothetical protein [Oscillospiraceae bacterium]